MTIYQEEHIPYTYLIGWSLHNVWYYGRRTRKGCNPKELWIKYFTSSGKVHEFRQKYGEPDIITIRKIFCGPNKTNRCCKHEAVVLRRMNAVYEDKWLNKGNSGEAFDTTGKVIAKNKYTGKIETIDVSEFNVSDDFSGINSGITFPKSPCIWCGIGISINNIKNHTTYCEYNPDRKVHHRTGSKMSKEACQLMRKNHPDVSGMNNPKAKKWVLTSPTGEKCIINGSLNQTLASKGLSRNHLVKCLGRVVTRPYTVRSLLTKNTIGWKLELVP